MSVEWMIIRGSGIAAFAALSAATIWGLLVSSKLLGRLVKAKPLTWFHESLGIVALLATVVHVVVLSMHDYLEFTWTEILVPGASDWRSGAVTFGVVSFYGLTIVVTSFYIKKHIGQKTWRLIHFSSLGVFLASLIHGVSAGTDTRSALMIGLYLGSAGVVALLILARLTGAGEMGRSARSGGAVSSGG
ncbi:MAG TPA: ferric reductase-like transmembrane domain-containing protein [Acidimicrobiia bacterium]